MIIQELLSETLGPNRFQIILADNAERALEILERERPHLILLDVMLPGPMNGLEVARKIRTQFSKNACPIFMITAKGQTRDIQAGYDAGANEYFIKPFSPTHLLERADAHLGG